MAFAGLRRSRRTPRTIYAIRAHIPGPDVERTIAWIESFAKAKDIYVVVDEAGPHEYVWPKSYQIIRMTTAFLDKQQLYRRSIKVGWLCGDYFYYALRDNIDFEFAWLIEPDVVFNFEPAKLFEFAATNQSDLVGAAVNKRDSSWSWHKTMTSLGYEDVFSVFYPMTRLSASLIDEMLRVRQSMRPIFEKDKNLKYPNDEALTATVASRGNFSTLELKDYFNGMFTHFQYAYKWLYPDVLNNLHGDKVIHPAVGADRMTMYVREQVEGLSSNASLSFKLIKNSLSVMDVEQRQFFASVAADEFRSLLEAQSR